MPYLGLSFRLRLLPKMRKTNVCEHSIDDIFKDDEYSRVKPMRSFHLGILGNVVVPGVGSSFGSSTFVSVSRFNL